MMRWQTADSPGMALSRRGFLGAVAAGVAANTWCPRADGSLDLPAKPNLLVVLSDSLRADRLGCYGAGSKATPNLDLLSKECLLFEQCYSTSPWTTPATLTLLTGMLATRHRTVCPEWSKTGVQRSAFQTLSPEYKTTAELLKEAEYKTGYFTATLNAIGGRGHERGFDKVWYELNSGPVPHVDEAIQWLQGVGDAPFYAYLHLIDPHEPYQATPQRFEQLCGKTIEASLAGLQPDEAARLGAITKLTWDDYYSPENQHVRLFPEELRLMSPEAIVHFENLYLSEILLVDEAIGKLWQWLQKQPFAKNTIVVFTADHGESFGEQGCFFHASSLFDSQLHIPLMIHLPGISAGQRIPWTVGLHDISPTLLTLAGCPIPANCQGQSLLKPDGSLDVREHRTVFASLDMYLDDLTQWDHALIEGPIKALTENAGTLRRVFDRKNDPAELNSIPARERFDGPLRAINDRLSEHIRQVLEAAGEEAGRPVWTSTKQVEEEALRALGYVQ